jgi:hypothetical protein
MKDVLLHGNRGRQRRHCTEIADQPCDLQRARTATDVVFEPEARIGSAAAWAPAIAETFFLDSVLQHLAE